jgi:hypothetical protein
MTAAGAVAGDINQLLAKPLVITDGAQKLRATIAVQDLRPWLELLNSALEEAGCEPCPRCGLYICSLNRESGGKTCP